MKRPKEMINHIYDNKKEHMPVTLTMHYSRGNKNY